MSRIMTRRTRSLLAIGVLVASFGAAAAEAQQIHLFTCKVVCGYESGNVRLLNDTTPIPANHPYEDLKPGNYATTCNMFNYDLEAASQPVLPYLAVEGAPLLFLGQVDVASLTANAFGCIDILIGLGNPPLNGASFEGYVTFFTFDPDFDMDAVYTYSSQNAFERHVLWFYDPFGLFGIAFQTLGLTLGNITNPLPPVAGELPSSAATASGAGGNGLGASIDVEDIERIDIDLTTPGSSDRMPDEVRARLPI